ncbi:MULTISPECIES: aspartate aminotransferase family protein [Henriciella]|jgi:acetylornithine/succinyldiaminopimelate/putrescine aminotransferase|uniref:Aspartate aminotransferase family protein n=1 Tax=Henriciella pelagia TaxID=1977912 RepID=A0ABQ1K0A5_9PROT|nr:aminotransferase class III-fold pyridoxal phosphate-dependent enzyme [Henriciella pelagia]GGB81084.1 aspartate aminotransferase family protein [Henriciella pelagia]
MSQNSSVTEIRSRATNRIPLLSLEESLELDHAEANGLFERHLNKYLLQIWKILGYSEMDIVSAKGCEIYLKDGRTLTDFSAGIGILGLGHNHPRIIAAERMCHDRNVIDMNKLAPHKLQGALAYNIVQYLPEPLDMAYLAVSGSEAVEAAMKLCERIQTPKGKTKFICMEGAFHGKTHGPLSVTTAHTFQNGFLMGVPKENVIAVPFGDMDALRAAVQAESDGKRNNIIAIMVEPIRGEACEVAPEGYLTEVARFCRENDILSFFDEVKTGMGRTGKFCAFQHEDVVPDVTTLAKTLGGGKREIGAMVTSRKLWEKAYGSKATCTLHTSGFGGMGESCAVAIETLNVLQDEGLIENAAAMGDYMRNGLLRLQEKHPKTIVEVMGKGLFQAIRLNFGRDTVSKLVDISSNPLFKSYETVLLGGVTRELFEHHNILVHFQPGARDILHFIPPLIIEERQIDLLLDALDQIFERGLADSTVKFVAKNIKQVFAHD